MHLINLNTQGALWRNSLRSLVKAWIRAVNKLYASSEQSPTILLRRLIRIARTEGIRGVHKRTVLWLALSGMRSDRSAAWNQLYPYPDASASPQPAPKVSVIVPNYNHAPYLRKRLDSIYAQTYGDFEVILLDDCSTDESRVVLEEYAARYPEKTICSFNQVNSGGVFQQWKKGFELATGELVWIAESDDYSSANLLEELVVPFSNPAIRLAFCTSDFVGGPDDTIVWNSNSYLSDLGLNIWNSKFIASAHSLTKHAWVVKNIIPNVSAALFKHPGKMPLLSDEIWRSLRLCGDWIFYLALIRGGLVAYSPKATNFYRQHASSTSTRVQKEHIYYQEHQIVRRYVSNLYRIDASDLRRQRDHVYRHWCIHHDLDKEAEFQALYTEHDEPVQQRRLNIAIATYALISGGGETLPLMLANLLQQRGHAVVVINFQQLPSEPGVQALLSPDVPLLDLHTPTLLSSILTDMGIDVIHSHHGWVDMTVAALIAKNASVKHVVTMHGMYEIMTPELFASLQENLERVDHYVYTADKNLEPFSVDFQARHPFTRINNAVTANEYPKLSRAELGIAEDDFVLCFVARGRDDKGWQEGIEAVLQANDRSERAIHLLLIGDGEEPKRLKPKYSGFKPIHFLGFQRHIRSYFECADMGFIPSRFQGESFPLVLIDSLMTGKPVLASAIGEIPLMLKTETGLAGEVFALTDWQIQVDSLADIISRLANDQDYFKTLAARVPEAARKFDANLMAKAYEDVYYSLCDAAI